jgi:hypothetical protein
MKFDALVAEATEANAQEALKVCPVGQAVSVPFCWALTMFLAFIIHCNSNFSDWQSRALPLPFLLYCSPAEPLKNCNKGGAQGSVCGMIFTILSCFLIFKMNASKNKSN